ncbi:peptidase M3 [Pseudomonas xanthosomatis]|uniref:M3 family metallopeptidase n=1 Tax=Pseudomonas xanthosomatis TaxID=2842356 RepID=UPI001C3E2FB7|nr:M3 family metallopeptidase [Pseudomonas xanthosomatis]QXH46654.1 peptidase M3 [Pseudomonas xanthosomatis]
MSIVEIGPDQLLDYTNITPEQAHATIERAVSDYQHGIERVIVHQQSLPTWDDLVLAVDALDARLQGVIFSFIPLMGRSEQWRAVIQTWRGPVDACFKGKLRNVSLLRLYQDLADSDIGRQLGQHKKTTLRLILEEYRLGGALLDDAGKLLLESYEKRIRELEGQFFANLGFSVEAAVIVVDDEQRLAGLSAQTCAEFRDKAIAASLPGWLIPCDQGTYETVMAHAQVRSLREQVYRAYMTRGASDDPTADNGPVMQALAQVREDQAQLLGFDNYPQMSMQRKSSRIMERVLAFLDDLQVRIQPRMLAANDRLRAFAATQGLDDPQPWDLEYLRRVQRGEAAGLSEQRMREFFALGKVIDALSELARTLFGLHLQALPQASVWHPSVITFEVQRDHASIGFLYLDVVQHEGKTPDMVMTVSPWNRRTDAEGIFQRAVSIIFSDVPPGVDGQQPLLDHLALKKLFHEFGHALQHLLAQTGNHLLSDARRLGSDGVEVAGKLLECWVWNADYLASISSHYLDGGSLQAEEIADLLEHMQASDGSRCATLLSHALLDLDIHHTPRDGRSVEQRVLHSHAQAGLWPMAGFEKPLQGFDYLASGYDAGYYAYLWAELHAWDLFTRFEAAGLLDPATGRALFEQIFAPGVSRPLLEGIEAFLERPVSAERFMRFHGLD